MPAAVRAKWKIVQLTWHLTSRSSRTGGERRRKEKGRGERAQFVERPFLKEEAKSKMRWHPPTFRAYLQKPELTHSSNDHRINAKASLPFSSCFLDFKIACSYGLDSDNLLHKCSRKTCKKTSPWSLSVPWELPSPANWICILPSSSGTAHAQWPSQKRSLETPQYTGNTLTSSRSALGKLALISTHLPREVLITCYGQVNPHCDVQRQESAESCTHYVTPLDTCGFGGPGVPDWNSKLPVTSFPFH